MKYLKFGCARTEIFLSPDIDKLSKKEAMSRKWFVEFRFYDPKFKEKYPKGFPVRKEFNRYKTFAERAAFGKELIKKLEKLIDAEGFNPITKQFMDFAESEYREDLPVFAALELALKNKEVSKGYKDSIKSALHRMQPAFTKLGFDYLQISDVKLKHIKAVLDHTELTAYSYNKYKTYLHGLFTDLIINSCIDNNPCTYIPTKSVIVEKRAVLSDDNFVLVKEYIKRNYPDFYRYFCIFFMSGARSPNCCR